MDPKKLSIRLSAKGKKEEKAGKEDRRLAPMMRALKAIHSVGAPDSMNPEDLAKQRAGQELPVQPLLFSACFPAQPARHRRRLRAR